jgi:hypothetical protein
MQASITQRKSRSWIAAVQADSSFGEAVEGEMDCKFLLL